MMLGFFKLPKHRNFNYKPRYYDPIKEEVQERVKKIEQEISGDKDKYVPGSSIRGGIRHQYESSRRAVNKTKMQRLLIRLMLIALIILILYFVQKFL